MKAWLFGPIDVILRRFYEQTKKSQDRVKQSRLSSESAGNISAQNPMSSRLLSISTRIQRKTTISLFVVLYWHEILSLKRE